MGDILKLEELKQEGFSLTAKRTKLQAMVLWLKEEKQLQEAALQSECGRFKEEKQQLGSLISSLQSSLSKSHWAQERLEQHLQTQDAKRQPGQLLAFNVQHEQTGKELCPAAAPAAAGCQCIPVQVHMDTSHGPRSPDLL